MALSDEGRRRLTQALRYAREEVERIKIRLETAEQDVVLYHNALEGRQAEVAALEEDLA